MFGKKRKKQGEIAPDFSKDIKFLKSEEFANRTEEYCKDCLKTLGFRGEVKRRRKREE